MKNLFKFIKADEIISAPPEIKVEEIHEAFNTEVDRLLESCAIQNSLESENQHLVNKYKRLKKLGFTNTSISDTAEEEITRLAKLEQNNKTKLDIIKAINYFKQKYPHYKFITKESVNILCNKYGLIFGDVENYIGDVPEKNIVDIENFKIDDIDKCFSIKEFGSYISNYSQDANYRPDLKVGDTFGFRHSREYNNKPFTIVAPVKDFDTDGMKLHNNELIRIPVIKDDPIVLQPVRFNNITHYLIVTAWGDEASDTLVVNENHN